MQIGLVVSNYYSGTSLTASFSNISFTGNHISLGLPDNTITTQNSAELPEVEVYPNPTTGELNIDLNHYSSKPVKIELYDFQGQLLQFSELSEVHQSIHKMDLSNFSSGIFLIRVTSNGLPDVTKRVVLH